MMISMKFHHSYRVLWSKQKKRASWNPLEMININHFSRQGLTESPE